MAPLLEVTGLRAAYGGVTVLDGVELHVPEGQLLCVLGPSGGGKSTLLRVIAGLEVPTSGRLGLAGRDLAGVPTDQRGIGLMFQDYALFPHRDVGDNVAFGLRMRGDVAPAIRARVAELLALVGLAGAERRPVAQLSGGEQQRVALARALAAEPKLLMLDEPMGSLDRSLRERLPAELRAIFGELGLTVMYVTHDQDEALSVADRVVILERGHVVADGTPEELWTRPPSAWVARFLGFSNVAAAELHGSVLSTPWGPIDVADREGAEGRSGPVTVVLRASAIVPATDGSIHGRVVARRFRGDHVSLSVAVEGAPDLSVEARDAAIPEVGASIDLAVRPGGVHIIADAAALPSAP